MSQDSSSPLSVRTSRRFRTWIEVDRRALKHNLQAFRRRLPPGCLLMAVAKSNAYGHGLYDFAPAMEALPVDWFGVDSIVEAVRLREIGVHKPILVLGYTLPRRFREAKDNRIHLTISSLESLRALCSLPGSRHIGIHLKLDTGMHRQGFLGREIRPLIRFIEKNRQRLTVEGLYTHFASAKDPASRESTEAQVRQFDGAVRLFRRAGIEARRHACATAGVLNYPEAHYEMVRVGIGLLGLWPSVETRRAWEKEIALRPALAWRTIVSETKRLKKGARVGYDLTESLTRDSLVGICPVGYWHGFPRSLSRVGQVLVRGRRAKVVGSVSMDMIVVDLTDIDGARPGDIATVIGRDGSEEITAYEIASRAGVSHYELVTRINPLIQKIYFS